MLFSEASYGKNCEVIAWCYRTLHEWMPMAGTDDGECEWPSLETINRALDWVTTPWVLSSSGDAPLMTKMDLVAMNIGSNADIQFALRDGNQKHRFHFCSDGTIERIWFVDGKLKGRSKRLNGVEVSSGFDTDCEE